MRRWPMSALLVFLSIRQQSLARKTKYYITVCLVVMQIGCLIDNCIPGF